MLENGTHANRRAAMPPACRLLVELCRADAETRVEPDRLALLDAPQQRRAFLDLAALHSVLGLALSAVDRIATTSSVHVAWAEELHARLRFLRQQAAMRAMKRDLLLDRIADAGLPVVVLKGAALVEQAYSRAHERDAADLDFLVPHEALPRVVTTLTEAGYRHRAPERVTAFERLHFHVPLVHRDGHYVEVHWSFSPRGTPFQLDPRAVLARARPMQTARATDWRMPCPEHMILHLALQNIQEGFSRLGRFVDIDRLLAVAPIDWQLLHEEAARGNLGLATALTLRITHGLWGTPVPAHVWQRLAPSGTARAHLALMRPIPALLDRRWTRSWSARALLELWLLDRARDRVRGLGRLLESDTFREEFERQQRGVPHRFARLTKLALRQLGLYFAAGVAASRGQHAQMRFWSSHASSSERL